jgi:hypothetical protein
MQFVGRAFDAFSKFFWPILFISWIPFLDSRMAFLTDFTPDNLKGLFHTFPVMKPAFAIFSLILAIVYSVTQRSIFHFVAALPVLVVSGTTLFVNPDEFEPIKFSALIAIYLIAVTASIFAYAVRRAKDDTFLGMIFSFYAIDTLLSAFGASFSFFGLVFYNHTPSFIGLALLALLLFVLRCIWLVYDQNKSTFSTPGDNRKKQSAAARASALSAWKSWWPMIVLFIAATSFYYYQENFVIVPKIKNCLHNFDRCESRLFGVADDQLPPANAEPLAEDATIQTLIESLIARRSLEYQAAAKAQIEQSKNNILAAGDQAEAQATNEVNNALPSRFPGTETKRCGFLDIPCLLANGVKSMVNTAYTRSRDRQLAIAQSKIQKANADVEAGAEGTAQTFVLTAEGAMQNTELAAIRFTRHLFNALQLISFILSVYAILVLVKSFLVVFSRHYYSSKPMAALADGDENEVFGQIRKANSVYSIPNNDGKRFYVKYEAIGVNVVDRKRIPYWYKSLISRMLNGCYALCLVDTSTKFQGKGDIKVDPPGQIVVWMLKENEHVVFSFSDFIAMSAELKLAKKLRLKLSSLIFGKILFQFAEGPGTLILRTKSAAIAGDELKAASSLNAEGLIAWNAANEFYIVSSHEIVDTFFSHFSLKKTDGDLIVYDTSASRHKHGMLVGLWRTARTFLSPI